ncbi:MAG: hypothetical protein AAF441_06550 [Pseudomonadota bacterium]
MKTLVDTRQLLYDAYGVEPDDKPVVLPEPDAEAVAVARIAERADMVRRLAARIAAEMPEGTVNSYLPLARALLKELREPTSGMLESAFPDMMDCGDVVCDWQALIDAAIESDQAVAEAV